MPTNPLLTELYNILKETQTDLDMQELTNPQLIAIKEQIDILVILLEKSEQEDIDEFNEKLKDYDWL